MKFKEISFCIVIAALMLACSDVTKDNKNEYIDDVREEKIEVLNFGTFHMRYTPDAHSVKFNERDLENQKQVHDIAKKLAAFKPTVILVEKDPKFNDSLQKQYNNYVADKNMFFESPSEVELLAFELGRLSGVKRIYGINHKIAYNYSVGFEISNAIDSVWYNQFYRNPFKYYPKLNVNQDSLSVLEKLIITNKDDYFDFLISVNADMLTHAGTEDKFEGADEAAKFYKRNLRMYSNLNRIKLKENDRVFILMGATHTAFFRDFISRSPKYKMVNTFDYLK